MSNRNFFPTNTHNRVLDLGYQITATPVKNPILNMPYAVTGAGIIYTEQNWTDEFGTDITDEFGTPIQFVF